MEVAKTTKYRRVCPSCNSELIFTKADVKNPLFDAQHIKCPICKRKIYISGLWMYEVKE